jgi:hypothetical protein
MRTAPTITVTFDAGSGATFETFSNGNTSNSVYQGTNHSGVATARLTLSSEL